MDDSYQQRVSTALRRVQAADIIQCMGEARLDDAVQRVSTAMDRLEAALVSRAASVSTTAASAQSSQHELELISQHEKMQSEVRDTLTALDELISGLEK
ncbi:hypothetical protein ACRAQ6_12500 [Erythrobacter sp. HA6-11]